MTDSKLIGQTARDYIRQLVLPSDPLRPLWNRENQLFRKQPKWNYIDSCMIGALLMYAGEQPELLDFAVRFTDSYVSEDGSIPTMVPEDFNLDNIRGGVNLIRLYEMTGRERYRLAADKLFREQLARQPRLNCGCFWHKGIYPYQVWLDGVYMALPFMVMYGQLIGDDSLESDALSQLRTIWDVMRDPETGLYRHGFDETRSMNWADSETGLSPEYWLRSNGWLCAGLADLYELTGYSDCAEMLWELTDSLSRFASADGMLMQLPARSELTGNYPETSGTLLFAYGAMKGRQLGAVSKTAAATGKQALYTVTEKYIDRSGDIPVLRNICLMGGLGGASERDGSPEYYLSEPIVENDAKGIAPYLMAAMFCD